LKLFDQTLNIVSERCNPPPELKIFIKFQKLILYDRDKD
jgi:hypothetical protein